LLFWKAAQASAASGVKVRLKHLISPESQLTFCTDRVYDAFWTQTPVGMAEFSDQPLPPIPDLESYYGFFPAKHVTEYLESYVESHVYGGQPLSERIRLNNRVTHLVKRHETGLWHACICVQPQSDEDEMTMNEYTITAPKVIDATGLTSSPYIPNIASLPAFPGDTIHQKDVAQSSFLADTSKHNIIVIGGAKSAADISYAAAKAEKSVTWVIRRSGSGPASFAPAKGSGMYKNSNESFYTRLTALFIASVFVEEGGLTWSFGALVEWFLYRTTVGTLLLTWIWKRVTARAWGEAGYTSRQVTQQHLDDSRAPRKPDGAGKGFHNLQPDTDIFWQNDSSGINQRPDFFSTIVNGVDVYREDIERIDERGVTLTDKEGTHIAADVLVFATGWDMKASYAHLDDSTAYTLGLPVPKSLQSTETASKWSTLDAHASTHILQRFPVLAHPPPHYSDPVTLTPLRLYKAMLPISDPSIIFLGKIMLGNHFRTAEVQALWALSVIDDVLDLPTEETMQRDVAETVAWCKKRYLGKGQLGNWFWFDMVPYTDTLLAQLGMWSHRKEEGRGWMRWKELVRPCFAKDLRGLIAEYKTRNHNEAVAS
jgi:dimethylaniline monooxygenase (N-oxide forming)